MIPTNAITGVEYAGKNFALLCAAATQYPTAEFLTFKQALSINRCVRKGEHGFRILKVVENEGKDGKTRRGIRGYTVFNIAQTDPLEVAA